MAAGPRGRREIAARDFFRANLMTALEAGELLTEIRFPRAAPGTGACFQEVGRRSGDFALVGVAAPGDRPRRGGAGRPRVRERGRARAAPRHRGGGTAAAAPVAPEPDASLDVAATVILPLLRRARRHDLPFPAAPWMYGPVAGDCAAAGADRVAGRP